MNFVATDGTVFTNRSEYRKYEMETQYTFRDKNHSTLTKLPGSVSGQPFNITNCSNSTLAVLDYCDQVQIDNVTASRIFIGASSESVFIRDCNDCTFTIACKQLRTRDCVNCTIYLHCKTEPIIESSTGMKFGKFNGAYPGHDKAMKEANLDPKHNLWHAVYDFCDEFKTNHNWSYVKEEEKDELWCPIGEAENCCSRVNGNRSNKADDRMLGERSDATIPKKEIVNDEKWNEIQLNDKTVLKELNNQSWLDFVKTYVQTLPPIELKSLIVDSLNRASTWIKSMTNSIPSFWNWRKETSD